MLDLSKNKRIIIHTGYTDMRLGVLGLTKLIGVPKTGCAYVFCGSNGHTIKVIEYCSYSVWLHIKRTVNGKFTWPMQGDAQNIDFDTLRLLIESVDELAKLENTGTEPRTVYY